jgi:Family of unknown function (DUF6232)
MTVDRIFYTNGHDVTVSDSMLTVKKKKYRLPGITRHGLRVLKPIRIPGLILASLGALVMLLGSFQLISSIGFSVIRIFRWTLDADVAILIAGGFVAAVGLLVTFLVRPQYAVHISTAEGENDVIISREREYVRQVVDALNRAFMAKYPIKK